VIGGRGGGSLRILSYNIIIQRDACAAHNIRLPFRRMLYVTRAGRRHSFRTRPVLVTSNVGRFALLARVDEAGWPGAAGARERLHRGGSARFASLTLRPDYETPSYKRVYPSAREADRRGGTARAAYRKLAFHFYHYHI